MSTGVTGLAGISIRIWEFQEFRTFKICKEINSVKENNLPKKNLITWQLCFSTEEAKIRARQNTHRHSLPRDQCAHRDQG